MDKREADRGVLDDLSRWEVGVGIAIRTTTRIVEGDLKPSSVTEIFEQELVLLSTDIDASEDSEEEGTVELGFNLKNFLARVSKEGVLLLVETSAVGRFSSSSPLCAEGFIGVETGMGTGEVVLVKLGGEPLAEQGTDARGSA